ncbi:MAG: NAD-dependent epimerase/dehydratase family protein [Candidatus Aminicenantes bacterium]|nr:NAD-dependent epimerase/dehydratase family protein [Candidatus Aminicenantes bacterium]
MKTLVTGGAGFIGSNVVQLLLEQGHQVKILDNLSTGYFKNIKDIDAEFIKGDIRNEEIVQKAASQVDVIFHLAAHIGNVKSLQNPIEDSEINVLGTLNVLEAAKRNGIKKIIHSSSAGIFGELQYMPIDEKHPLEPDSFYGVSKLTGEKHALCYGKIYGMVVVCLRYFNAYGINQRYDDYGNVIPIFSNRLLNNQPLIIYGDGEQTRDFVNAKDIAKLNLLAAEKATESGVYNVGCGKAITINYLASLMQEVAGKKVPIEYAPPRKGEVRLCRADISAIQKTFGYNPDPDIKKGFEEYYEWFKNDNESK